MPTRKAVPTATSSSPPGGTVRRFFMASRREAVAPMVERILASVSGLALSRDQTENLAVALAEALSNAVVHGHRQRHEKRVRIELTLRPRCCVVEVTDSGDGFDTRAVEDPTAPQRVLSPGGRGVYLMRRLVDRVEYNAKGNRVRLTVVRHALGRSGA